MTVQPPASAFRATEDFRALRSQLIDEFARLELAVSLCLCKLGHTIDPRKTTFSHQVTELSTATPSPSLSKGKAAALASLAGDCGPLKRLRTSVVHGVMEVGTLDGQSVALFRNVADIVGGELIYHVLTEAEFRSNIRAVALMTDRVKSSLNSPMPAARIRPAK